MTGHLQPQAHRSQDQPTVLGSPRDINDNPITSTSLTRISTPPLFQAHPQPSGALHPATPAPISAGPSVSSSRFHYPQPTVSQYRFTPSTPPLCSPTGPPPCVSSSSVGLERLADAALLERAQGRAGLGLADRRLAPPAKVMTTALGRGRFWDDQTSDPKARLEESTPPSPRSSFAAPSTREAPLLKPSSAPVNPHFAHCPTRPSSRTAPAATATIAPTPVALSTKPQTARKQLIHKRPHPLADMDLDKEYNPPTVTEWEQRALRVMHLPPIPEAWYSKPSARPHTSHIHPALDAIFRGTTTVPNPLNRDIRPKSPAPPASNTTVRPHTPSTSTAIFFDRQIDTTASATSPKSTRPKRGSDRKPRATPNCASASPRTAYIPHDPAGRRIHPPPALSITGTSSDRDPIADLASPSLRTSNSSPGVLGASPHVDKSLQSRSPFEAHSTHRRAFIRSQQHSGSESGSSSSSRSSGTLRRQGSQAIFVGSEESGGGVGDAVGAKNREHSRRESSGSNLSQIDNDALTKLNLCLQLEIQDLRETVAKNDRMMGEKLQRIAELEMALEQAKAKEGT